MIIELSYPGGVDHGPGLRVHAGVEAVIVLVVVQHGAAVGSPHCLPVARSVEQAQREGEHGHQREVLGEQRAQHKETARWLLILMQFFLHLHKRLTLNQV